MRIANTGLPDIAGTSPVQEPARVEGPAATGSAPMGTAREGALQSAALAPAMDALRELPEIDQAKVAAVRDALAKGEINFDARKLAGLIARYHGGQG